MTALVYRNTLSTYSRWVGAPLHEAQPRGMAYETDTHFVHYYGKADGLWVISPGLAMTERKDGSLRDWIVRAFGAQDIAEAINPVGHSVAGVWRPGISDYDNIRQGLSTNDLQRHAALQTVRLLLSRLDEILLYIEPSNTTMSAFGHKTRELLIIACTEVENVWKQFLRAAGRAPLGRDFTTNDYVALCNTLSLPEYELSFNAHNSPPIRPFLGWEPRRPTQSLLWYDAYNQTKHDRETHFSRATLENCFAAVGACIVLFCVRFSPYPLYHEGGTTSALFRQHFDLRLRDCSPTTFYTPALRLPQDHPPTFSMHGAVQMRWMAPWTVNPLRL
jgi:hypothetical protein